MHRQIKLILIFALLVGGLVWAGGAPQAVQAQSAPAAVTMQAQAAFGGYFKYGEWLPIWVTVENSGRDIDGELRVGVLYGGLRSNFNAPAELPAGARKRIPVYILPNNFSREISVELVEGDTVVATAVVAVNPQANINFVVGLLAEERGTLPLIASIQIPGQTRPVTILDLDLTDLPDKGEGLRTLNVIVLNNLDTSTLTPQQSTALEAWVRQGGRLVIGGGAGAQKTTSGLPAALLPITLNGDTLLDDLIGIDTFANADPVRVPGPFLAATGEQAGGTTLAEAGGVPLVQELALGAGRVDFVALDLTAAPFDAWVGVTDFWQALLTPGASYPDYMPPDMSPRQQKSNSIYYALTNLPMLDLPSVRDLALLLGVYILLVGPVNYLILRWRKMLQIAWLTIPLITLVFAVSAFALGSLRRGSDVVINKISVAQLQSPDLAQTTSYVGLFSPGQESFELEVDTAGLLSPISSYYDPWSSFGGAVPGNTMTFVQSEPAFLRGLTVGQGSLQGFMVEGTQAGLGQITTDLYISGQTVEGYIENTTALDLEDVVVVVNSQFQKLGALAAGERMEVNLVLQDITQQPFYQSPLSYRVYESLFMGPTSADSRRAEVRRAIIESVFDSGSYRFDMPAPAAFQARDAVSGQAGTSAPAISGTRAFVIGWADSGGPIVTVLGEQVGEQTTAMLYQYIPVRFAASSSYSIPPGLFQSELSSMNGNFSRCGDLSSNAYYIGRGEGRLDFTLPVEMTDSMDTLLLGVVSERGWLNALEISIYDWQQDAWAEITPLEHGVNRVEAPGDYVRADGQVRLSVVGSDDFGNCIAVSLGMEGGQ